MLMVHNSSLLVGDDPEFQTNIHKYNITLLNLKERNIKNVFLNMTEGILQNASLLLYYVDKTKCKF